jgi:hypothetical protein
MWMEGNTVTLYPSIGNWSFTCRSHYWIRRNKVIWAGHMSQKQIERGRAMNRAAKQEYFKAANREVSNSPSYEGFPQSRAPGLFCRLWLVIKHWLKS